MINIWRPASQGRTGTIGPVPADPMIANCTFHGNSASRKGGGMYNEAGDPSLDNCVFRENHSNASSPAEGGGGLFNEGGSPSLWRCRFVGNTTTSGGAGLYNRHASPIILDTVFDRNAVTAIATTQTGGGILNNSSDATIADCTFTGNSASHGGGVENWLTPASTFVNCLFIKNRAAMPGNGDGGGLQSWGCGCTPHVIYCTFVETTASDLSGGLGASDESGGAGALVINCIFWGNRARNDAVAQIGSGATVVTYSCVQGGRSGEGNIDVDPLFADPENGDYRLKSQAGRWDPLSGNWIQDDVTSPCIDAGDPQSPIGLEPFPSGGFVNMGAYGATATASKTYFDKPVPQTIVAGDINGDGEVDQLDLEIMALHWTDDEPLLLP
ncbi:MAG: right-handed parallel beta-helix repeat-containing protein [Sedimentisphaerales bacterium]